MTGGLAHLMVLVGLVSAAPRMAAPAPIPCTVSADSVHARFAPERAFDGDKTDTESRWASAKTPEPHWIALRFDDPVTFDGMAITGHPGDLALQSAAVQTLQDDAWRPVAQIADNRDSVVELSFARTTATDVRLYVTRACRQDSCVRLFEIELLLGGAALPLAVKPAPRPPPEPPLEVARLLAAVEPLPTSCFAFRPDDRRTRRLMRTCHDSVREWCGILRQRAEAVPGMEDAVYYGGGTNREDDIRAIAYAALANAFLAEVTGPGRMPPSGERDRARADAVGALRYLARSHVTGTEECVNGGQWGNQWQSAMWARSVGLAGWILWGKLDAELQAGVARLVEFEADRFLRLAPKSSEYEDTGAEENAWNAQMPSLACNMMPGHPRAARWAEAVKRWMYNSLSVAADAEDDRPGDDGRPISGWVTTVNAHPDFTVENHGLVHVGYLKTTIAMLLEGAVPYLLTGSDPPQACLHHAEDAFQVLLKCMAWDASPVFFSGNDWKLVHTQNSDLAVYALLSLLAGNRHAAHLEAVGLPYIRRMQKVEGGYYNVRRDIEFGGVCATRLIACYLAHGILGAGAEPASEAEFDRAANGVTYLAHAKVVLHRTPTKFASFSWGPKCMALALPRDGNWVIWPHFSSYVGSVAPTEEPASKEVEKTFRPQLRDDGFSVTGVLTRFAGGLEQAISYTSLPDDVTVYIERLTRQEGFRIALRETGIIGLEYGLGANERTLRGAQGRTEAIGLGGEGPRTVEMPTAWLNIDGRVGHVVRRIPDGPNVMRYHDEVAGSGRVPKLQEWISLVGDAGDNAASHWPSWACVVTFLNQNARQTASMARGVGFTVEADAATCRIGSRTIRADFGRMGTRVE